MSESLREWISVQQERSQKALIDFLDTELALAFTFLDTAKIEADSDRGHSKAALEKARTALATVWQFQDWVADVNERRKIRVRANSLQAALDAFPASE